MPTRIRSNGMSIALVIDQLVSTAMAAIFLPVVSRYGYSSMFLLLGGCTVVYFLITAFLLPETRGETLEEIEQFFHQPAAAG
jgi:SP family myo-inositol transporter-like MFS transporter 13